jgi:hypothetical protein
MDGKGMQAIGIILLLISIGTVVGPVGAVVIMYRDNLAQIVVPPQINDIFSGNSSLISDNFNTNYNNEPGNIDASGIITPVIVDKQIDIVSRTFTLTVNFTNTFNFNLTLNQFSAGVVCSQHNYPLGNVQLSQAVEIDAGQTAQLLISGLWTQNAESHVISEHGSASQIDVNLVNVTIDVNGITIQQSEPVSIGSVPLG